MTKKILYIWIVALCASVGACLQVAATTDQKQAKKARKGSHLLLRAGFPLSDNTEDENIRNLREKGILVLEENKGTFNRRTYIILPEKDVNEFLKKLPKNKNIEKLKDLDKKSFIALMDLFLEETPYKCRNRVTEIHDSFPFFDSDNNDSASDWDSDGDKKEKVKFADNLKFVKGRKNPIYQIYLEEKKESDAFGWNLNNHLTSTQKKGAYLIGALGLIAILIYSILRSNKKPKNQGTKKKSSKGSKQK